MATFIKQLANKSKQTRSEDPSANDVDSLPFYMAAGEQKQKKKGDGGEEPDSDSEGGQKMAEKGEELKEEMDNLLDEIDSVLEENAEEFVKNYVQRGGE